MRFDSQAISEQYNIYCEREWGILGLYAGNGLRGARLAAQQCFEETAFGGGGVFAYALRLFEQPVELYAELCVAGVGYPLFSGQ